jgi:hypothetical protein
VQDGRHWRARAADGEGVAADRLAHVERLIENGASRPTGGRIRVNNLESVPATREAFDYGVVCKAADDQNAHRIAARANSHAQRDFPIPLVELAFERATWIWSEQDRANRNVPLVRFSHDGFTRAGLRRARHEPEGRRVGLCWRLSACHHGSKGQHQREFKGEWSATLWIHGPTQQAL